MKQSVMLTLLLVVTAVCLISGCAADQSVPYYPDNEQAVRITSDALKIINAGSEPYTLSYTVRSS